jgi:hypothetical protein
MQRLRVEFKRDGKRKCLDERPGELLRIYMGKFYGMVGRLNKEGGEFSFPWNKKEGADICDIAFAPAPYGEGPPFYATNATSRIGSGVGSS